MRFSPVQWNLSIFRNTVRSDNYSKEKKITGLCSDKVFMEHNPYVAPFAQIL